MLEHHNYKLITPPRPTIYFLDRNSCPNFGPIPITMLACPQGMGRTTDMGHLQ